jgi:hypothetical protein
MSVAAALGVADTAVETGVAVGVGVGTSVDVEVGWTSVNVEVGGTSSVGEGDMVCALAPVANRCRTTRTVKAISRRTGRLMLCL